MINKGDMDLTEISVLERRISEKLEPEPTFKLGLKDGRDLRSDGECWWMEQHHLLPDGTIEFPERSLHPRSWATDENANAELLETMPAPRLTRYKEPDIWGCHASPSFTELEDVDRKIVICLAAEVWLNGKRR